LTALSAGDHFLCQTSLYGGTDSLITRDLPKLGIEYDFIDLDDPGSWEAKLRPNTKAFYVESISNPLIQVGDLKAGADFAKAHNLVSMIDNTFTSPINFRPIEWGYDVSLHSCTKYLNGHSDIVAGAILGSAEWVEKIKMKLDHLGGTLDPHACFLLHRGVKTLALRVNYQNQSAGKIAEFLESHPKVEKVNYPGLKSHPNHARAGELFDGFGGMLSYELKGGLDDVDGFMRSVNIPLIAPSLGGVETLLTRPAATSHAGLTKEDLERSGITETLIRMSVGIESTDDIIDDLDQALSR
jgi:cystathionine beta-lyase/cystathionine gamma-synthase